MSDVAKPPVKQIDVKAPFKLRLWPAVVIIAIQLVFSNVPKMLELDNPFIMFMGMMFGPLIGLVGLTIWWLFFSRVSWLEGFGMLAFAAACGGALAYFAHPTMGMSLVMGALPMVLIVSVAWLIVSFFLPWGVRRLGLIIAIGFTCFYFSLLRFDGITGEFNSQISWRWNKTAEEKYLASRAKSNAAKRIDASEAKPLEATDGDWVAFRGSHGDSVYSGEPISENWTQSPPKLLWRRPIGPGWSSFVVVGDYVFTQEQRDKEEVVAAHSVKTGEPVWEFKEPARFEESVAGPGPRATPLFHEGKLYVVGATGIVHGLDAVTGEKVWRARMVPEGTKTPEWGYSSSPIMVGDAVVTMPGKPNDNAVVAFDSKTGEKRWSAAKGEHSYTTAHLATLCGVPQILALTSVGLVGVAPDSGKVLWTHEWDAKGVARCVQPYVDGDTVMISTFMGNDIRKVKITKDGDKWNNEVIWKSTDLKPYYNDLVVSDGFAYGFDNNIFGCLDLSTGKRKWKGGRYGLGQVLLLEKQKKLLVLSEQGEVVLLEVNPEKRVEVAKFKAIEGKTWNHPVVAHGKLFVRNGEEMACFDVSTGEKPAVAAKEAAPSH